MGQRTTIRFELPPYVERSVSSRWLEPWDAQLAFEFVNVDGLGAERAALLTFGLVLAQADTRAEVADLRSAAAEYAESRSDDIARVSWSDGSIVFEWIRPISSARARTMVEVTP